MKGTCFDLNKCQIKNLFLIKSQNEAFFGELNLIIFTKPTQTNNDITINRCSFRFTFFLNNVRIILKVVTLVEIKNCVSYDVCWYSITAYLIFIECVGSFLCVCV